MENADIFVPTKEGMEAAKKRLNERLKKGTTKNYDEYVKQLNSDINKLIVKKRKWKNRYYKEKQKNKELDLILKIVVDKVFGGIEYKLERQEKRMNNEKNKDLNCMTD